MSAALDRTAETTIPVPETDREARFVAFVSAHRDRALRLAWRLLDGDLDAAEDATQDALVRAHRALGGFREEAALSTWFYRILVREAQNQRRRRKVREAFGLRARRESEPEAADPGDPGLRRRIGEALGRLSPPQRQAFVLVHMEAFSVREAADIMGKPEGTVKSHLHRSLASLRAELADLWDEAGEAR